MIAYLNPLQGEAFLDLCCVEPIIGARVCSWYCCYANAYPFCDLWIIYSDKRTPTSRPPRPMRAIPMEWRPGIRGRCALPVTWMWTLTSWRSL